MIKSENGNVIINGTIGTIMVDFEMGFYATLDCIKDNIGEEQFNRYMNDFLNQLSDIIIECKGGETYAKRFKMYQIKKFIENLED